MICILALIVFGILGIFSATHRKIALEAFDCVFRRITLRKCTTGLDQKMRARVSAGLMNFSPRLSGFTFKYFEAISWAFTILLIASLLFSALGAYNFLVYGNCNGENSQEACIYTGVSGIPAVRAGCGSPSCQNEECECENGVYCPGEQGDPCKEGCHNEGRV